MDTAQPDKQPFRKNRYKDKVPAPRRFDQSQLNSKLQGRMIHRDYAAHWFRWGFANRLIKLPKNQHTVLDVGCGSEIMLSQVLFATQNPQNRPKLYVGIDLNPIRKQSNAMGLKVHAPFNFVDDWVQLQNLYEPFTHATCFEVIEHMEVEDASKLLAGVHSLLRQDGTFLLSTPVYDGKARARNHIHEFTVHELNNLLSQLGFQVSQRYGTFMNSYDIKKVAPSEQVELVERLSGYYSWDVLSNFLAPLYPDHSRNNLWVLKKAGHNG